MVTPEAKRAVVRFWRERLRLSERRACDLIGLDRSRRGTGPDGRGERGLRNAVPRVVHVRARGRGGWRGRATVVHRTRVVCARTALDSGHAVCDDRRRLRFLGDGAAQRRRGNGNACIPELLARNAELRFHGRQQQRHVGCDRPGPRGSDTDRLRVLATRIVRRRTTRRSPPTWRAGDCASPDRCSEYSPERSHATRSSEARDQILQASAAPERDRETTRTLISVNHSPSVGIRYLPSAAAGGARDFFAAVRGDREKPAGLVRDRSRRCDAVVGNIRSIRRRVRHRQDASGPDVGDAAHLFAGQPCARPEKHRQYDRGCRRHDRSVQPSFCEHPIHRHNAVSEQTLRIRGGYGGENIG